MRTHLKDYFIPHAGNEYAPHSLQRASIVGLLALALISFAATSIYTVTWTKSDWLISTVLPGAIVELTNDERVDSDMSVLVRNELLDNAATLKAAHMAQYEYFAHYSPDGVSPWYWFDTIGYDYLHAGENIAVLFTDSEDVVRAWMDSPLHRENILSTKYQEIGVGTAKGTYKGKDTVYVVQHFGTKMPEEVPAVVATAEETPRVAVSTEPSTVLGAESDRAEDVEPEEDTLVAEHISTSSPVAATLPDVPTQAAEPAMIEDAGTFTVATKPHTALQTLYTLIGLFVAVSLVLSIFIEIRHQHPLQVAYSLGLLVVLGGLFHIHSLITGTPLIL